MEGNVFEWVSGSSEHYSIEAQKDPKSSGSDSASSYLRRGGSWCHGASDARVSDRGTRVSPGFIGHCVGFRLVREAIP